MNVKVSVEEQRKWTRRRVFGLGMASVVAWAQSTNSSGKRLAKIVQFRVLNANEMIPKAVELPEGQYWFEVASGVLRQPLALQVLSRVNGSQANKIVDLPSDKGLWRDAVDLKPGTYTVSVVGLPRLFSTVTVTKAN